MKNKYKFMIIGLSMIILLFLSGITYSIFNSGTKLNNNDMGIAKFVFNAEKVDHIEIPLIDLVPGDQKEYNFSVSNNNLVTLSDVYIGYQITIKTYYFIPLVIELYNVTDGEEFVLRCDENYTNTRSYDNKLVCKTEEIIMENMTQKLDNYRLKIRFPENFNSEIFSNSVDFINLEISSWQKTER